jgi:hypothetical protein
LPFSALCVWLLGVTGNNDHIINPALYFVPGLTFLGAAASVASRRKGCSKSALIVELIGPAVFGLILFICAILGCKNQSLNGNSYEVVLLETFPKEATQKMISSGFALSLCTCTQGGASCVTVRCDVIN